MNELALARFVRPRVVDHGSGSAEPVRVEDALERRLEQPVRGDVFLHGPPGAGKRSALDYAKLYFEGRAGIAFGEREPEPGTSVRVRVAPPSAKLPPFQRIELVPWKRDEWIEYLLARHRSACGRIMERLESPENELELKGRPLLWAALLDELALDAGLPGAFEALRRAVRRRFSSPEAFDAAAGKLWLALSPALDVEVVKELREIAALEPDAAPFLDQSCVHVLLAAEHVSETLARGSACPLPPRLHGTFLRAIRPLLREKAGARATLERFFEGGARTAPRPAEEGAPEPGSLASAASLLHCFGPTAVADVLGALGEGLAELPRLSGAALDGLEAPGVALRGAQLDEAHLDHAQIDGADLSEARLDRATLRGCSLRGAKLAGASARAADFSGADLRAACLDEALLNQAQLDEARLEAALLRKTVLDGAALHRALLDRADLTGASLKGAHLAEASFIDANLTGAILDGLDLRGVRLETAKLANASLVGCNLEQVRLDKPDLSIADLRDALLTGSRFGGADLRGAQLGGAGLARIEWPGANLREADLTNASFHLGSARSGLVLSAPAGWGARTGFYTDELRETTFRRSEIRKADLRRADLRGARILDTDFYLVDVRGALYTSDQERHLRSCGAIL
jgi:uncharacterized protein YjbI with pentapeptide repeats